MQALCWEHSTAAASAPDIPLVSPPLQITQLKIDHNPFAKGFRDNFDS